MEKMFIYVYDNTFDQEIILKNKKRKRFHKNDDQNA